MDDEIEEFSSLDINSEIARGIAASILKAADGVPLSASLSVLNGFVIALAAFIDSLKEQVIVSEEDGIEKMVLSWLSVADITTANNFSKYISTKCVNIDINGLLNGEQES